MISGMLSLDEFNEIFNSEYRFEYETVVNKIIVDYLDEQYKLKIEKCFFENQIRYGVNNNKRINHICVYVYSYDELKKKYIDKMINEKNTDILINLKKYVIDYCLNNDLTKYIDVDNLFVSFSCFEDEAIGMMRRKSFEKMKTEFIPRFFNCETMEQMYGHLIVIYKNKEMLNNAIEIGETKIINDAFYEFIKPYDEYDFLNRENTKVRFDCMENVEAHGGWFHYDREYFFR